MTKRVLIAGGSGMIGHAVGEELARQGWEIHVLTRDAALVARDPQAHLWNPEAGLSFADLPTMDAVINLAGSTIARMPWTRRRREAILNSRVSATRAIVDALDSAPRPPATLVNASAVGFYGSRGDEVLTETSSAGEGFLADVCRSWEEATRGAPKGTRVVIVRIGLVIAATGAMSPLRLLARTFLAGPLAGGRAWWPWVGLDDVARILAYAVTSRVTGVINAVGPEPATSDQVIRSLATHLHRPYWLPAPGWAIKLLLGQAGRELLLSSQRVEPTVLRRETFTFAAPSVDMAIRDALSS